MEVFLAGLPLDLTDKQLKQNLAPHIAAINLAEWACQKQRKKNFGTITFQHVHDGERFLRQYGELGTGLVNHRGKEYMQARLTIMKTLIHCRRSNREPDPFMLRSLKKDVQDLKANEEWVKTNRAQNQKSC